MLKEPIIRIEDALALEDARPISIAVEREGLVNQNNRRSVALEFNTLENNENEFNGPGVIPESWACVDCSINTAPGCLDSAQREQSLAANLDIENIIDERSEVYVVKPRLWKAAGMKETSGCLCIGCLEMRIGRRLMHKDFSRKHTINRRPGTTRLLSRRDGPDRACQFR
jgi:hypothetical protein